jgi:hypothetical protein
MARKKKLTTASVRSRTSLPYIVFCILLIVTSCGLPGLDTSDQSDQKNTAPQPAPIVASYTVPRILQYCADTYPLVPDNLFKSAAALVADMLDNPGSIHTNEGKVQVYISYITSFSYLKDAFSWSVDAIGADQQPSLQPTPDPAKYQNPYDHSSAVATVTNENAIAVAAAQAQWNKNHVTLAAARSKVKQFTNRLRFSFANINDPTGEDVGSCLQTAQERMRGFVGRKTIILSSPLAEDAATLPFIDLTGISVEVINWNCVFRSAQACIASRAAWEAKLLSFHSLSASIKDPQQSIVDPPTF